MHLIYILFGSFFIVYGVALDDPKSARILEYEFENIGAGPYHYSFYSSDGISKQEIGEVQNAGTEYEFVKVVGSFSYPGPDGVMYEVHYTADDQGFHPEGEHIVVPPFVPWVHHHHHEDSHKHYETGVPKIAGEYNIDALGTSPNPIADYSGYSNPTTPSPSIQNHNGDGPSSTSEPLKLNIPTELVPDVAAEYGQSSSPEPVAPLINDDHVENGFSTTLEPPQPSLTFHSTPGIALEYSSPSTPSPLAPQHFQGSEIAGTSSGVPETNPFGHSAPPVVTEYYPANSPISSLDQIDESTPKPDNFPGLESDAKIPVGYFFPGSTMRTPLGEVQESRAYIPPVSSPKPFVS